MPALTLSPGAALGTSGDSLCLADISGSCPTFWFSLLHPFLSSSVSTEKRKSKSFLCEQTTTNSACLFLGLASLDGQLNSILLMTGLCARVCPVSVPAVARGGSRAVSA